MSYNAVARSIGRIVWIDRLLAPEDDLRLPSTANPAESYAYIIKDLEDAIAGLPATKVAGRANKYAAGALLSEVCLQALAYKNYPAAPAVAANDLGRSSLRFIEHTTVIALQRITTFIDHKLCIVGKERNR